jgi:hypothetical protein
MFLVLKDRSVRFVGVYRLKKVPWMILWGFWRISWFVESEVIRPDAREPIRMVRNVSLTENFFVRYRKFSRLVNPCSILYTDFSRSTWSLIEGLPRTDWDFKSSCFRCLFWGKILVDEFMGHVRNWGASWLLSTVEQIGVGISYTSGIQAFLLISRSQTNSIVKICMSLQVLRSNPWS